MSTVIYPSPIFGPIHSRRLGISLGINLLPKEGKLCSFDCIYCECGFNADHRTHNPQPTPDEVIMALRQKLSDMKSDGLIPDVLTFAGNGEPTLHPQFLDIVKRVIIVRDELCPSARLSILSNATRISNPKVREALMLFDNNILKLDTVNTSYINKVDRPQGHYSVEEQIEQLALFNGHCIIQTMFMGGTVNGENVDTTGEEFIAPYLEAISRIHPKQVMIYTIDRETPAHGLKKASADVLDAIGNRIRAIGIPCSVSY